MVDSIDMTTWPEQLQLASHVSDVLFVVEAEVTSTMVARECLSALEDSGITVSGIVLNKRRDVVPQPVYEWFLSSPTPSLVSPGQG